MKKNDLFGNELYSFEMDDSILVVQITDTPPSLELIDEATQLMLNYLDGKKVKILVDPGNGIALNTEQRKFLISNLEKASTAVAVINRNWIIVLLHRLVVKVDNPEFQLKLVKDFESGKEWLDQLK